MTSPKLPARYEPLRRLGKGGGGEVWAVADRQSGARRALKMLAADATEGEMSALVREAVTLSGLEGLGVPRVLSFGRLPGSGRPYMVRELVEGSSLQEVVDEGTAVARCIEALAGAAEQVTMLHRAGLLHGDIKPANIIVEASGRATLVDLGLAAPWRERGTTAQGLTPKYAAPELFMGKPLTVRAEVYALGVALNDVLGAPGGRAELQPGPRGALAAVAAKATRDEPTERFPSADEFASALRRAAGLPADASAAHTTVTWPIVGIEGASSRLAEAVASLVPGSALALRGPEGSGRSVMLRRLAWSLGVEGRPIVYIDESLVGDAAAVRAELEEPSPSRDRIVLVDDAERLTAEGLEALTAAHAAGARLVVAGASPLVEGAATFDVPSLAEHVAIEVVRRAVPSLTDRLLRQIVHRTEGRPGVLRKCVRSIAEQAVVSEADVEELLAETTGPVPSFVPDTPLARATHYLDRGRYTDARKVLEGHVPGEPVAVAVARARLAVGLGEAARAVADLLGVEERLSSAESGTQTQWAVYLGRAHVGTGAYAEAIERLERVGDTGPTGAEAQAYLGLAYAYVGDDPRAREVLAEAVNRATDVDSARVLGIAHACLGVVHQRADRTEEARHAYERAVEAAERAGDASTLATGQLNLAGLLKVSGDLAGAIELFEAAVDTGRRSGRLGTVRNALLNLVNLDLYLGRMARARASIDALEEQRDALAPVAQAQLVGHMAELQARTGAASDAVRGYDACAERYEAVGLSIDAAGATLEGMLVAARQPGADVSDLARRIARAEARLGDSSAHRALLALARASMHSAAGSDVLARTELGHALELARESGQRDLIWHTLEARAELDEIAGHRVRARKDREEALGVLEEIAARLPRDLREVFWNDPRRRILRSSVEQTLGRAVTEHALFLRGGDAPVVTATSSVSVSGTSFERRLARILEVNTELLGEIDLDRLTTRVTDHAVDMLSAERGHVILRESDGSLTVRTSRARGGRSAEEEFSRSVAEQVMRTGEPVVSLNAQGDTRMQGFASVHQLMLESVACVPIRSRSGGAIGALYVETRLRPGDTFEKELPTLRAFADQVGIAIETATLLRQNQERANALADSNAQLEKAQDRLKELLGDREAELARAKAKLRAARDTLYGHFGYQGLVGTSAAMRRVYALIDRLKDTDVPVLITGESGTGKEVVARAIHRSSVRAKHSFIGVNCGAIPENLLESELFGHVRGAFTGADRERRGLLREAEGGTVLLDEIGEMPHKMQAGLLRVLQDRKVRPVGGTEELAIDTRLIFATHRDLAAMVRDGKFREDLFYRIHVVEVPMPPLRDRPEDIAPLVDHFLGLFAARFKRERKLVSREALRRLAAHDWPGNVRQLEHVLLNAWVLADSEMLGPEDFDLPEAVFQNPRAALEAPASDRAVVAPQRRETVSRHRRDEKARILEALEASNWNRVKAAELSGIPRRTFYRRLREYGIQ